MGSACSVENDGWESSSDESKINIEQKPFAFNTNDLDSIEGWLQKKSKHLGSWRQRYTVLNKDEDNDQFVLQTFKEKEKQTNPTECIVINHDIEIRINASNSSEFTLYHKPTKQSFVFKANSTSSSNRWLNTLQCHYTNIIKYEDITKYTINIVTEETNSKIQITNTDSNKVYSALIMTATQRDILQKGSKRLKLKLDRQKNIMTVIYCDDAQTHSIVLNENIPKVDEHKKQRDLVLENNKKSYAEYDIKFERKDEMLNIEIKQLESDEIYCTNIKNCIKMVPDLLQFLEQSKQNCTLKMVLKQCNKVAQMLNMSENCIELILELNDGNYIIQLKPKKRTDSPDSKCEGKSSNESAEESGYKSALSHINGSYSSIENLCDRSAFKQHKNDKDPITKNMKKIMREIRKDLPKNIYTSFDNGSMFVRFDESNPRFLQAMLIGLKDTPYYNGCFLFDIYLGNDYPTKAPQVKHTTNGAGLPTANNGPGGFSPNLHKSTGKVCLSLLGTWSGPGWTADQSNVYQILSTLLFMVFGAKHPYYMEPNYGGWEGTANAKTSHDPKVFQYDEELLYHTAKSTMLDVMKNPYIGFEEVIKVHFKLKRKQIVQHMSEVMGCKDYSKAFKNKIKPIHEQIKTELGQL